MVLILNTHPYTLYLGRVARGYSISLTPRKQRQEDERDLTLTVVPSYPCEHRGICSYTNTK